MQYREAAVRISQTIRMVNRELAASVDDVFEYESEGKVSTKEADAYVQKIQCFLDKLLTEVLEPVCELYPDLRPRCDSCDGSQEHEDKPS